MLIVHGNIQGYWCCIFNEAKSCYEFILLSLQNLLKLNKNLKYLLE